MIKFVRYFMGSAALAVFVSAGYAGTTVTAEAKSEKAAVEKPAAEKKGVMLTQKENGESVDIKNGETMRVNLKGNRTTGYSWEVATLDEAVAKVDNKGYMETKSGARMMGGGGVFTFSIKAVAPGQTPLKLVYKRASDTAEPTDPKDIFEAHITVDK